MQPVVIDTSIIIEHLRLQPKGSEGTALMRVVQNENIRPVISTITIQELFEGKSTRKTEVHRLVKKTLELFEVQGLSSEIAVMAGEILRDVPKLIEFADASIAATALHLNAPVFTRNKKDFGCIRGLELFTL